MKKSRKYMSDESFNRLVESFNQAIEYERGDRDDCRVTVVAEPADKPANKKIRTVKSTTSLKQKLAREIDSLTEADLERVADYVDLLKFREQSQAKTAERRPVSRAAAVR